MSAMETPLPEEPPTLTDAEAASLWETFRSGRVALCPRDGEAMALSVDGASKCYRLVCTHCGIPSRWFSATPTSMTMRGGGVEIRFGSDQPDHKGSE